MAANRKDLSSKFTNTNGVYYIRKLFIDYPYTKDTALYTLRREDNTDGFPSLHRLYLETEDPTEWEFANKYFAGWDHWQLVAKSEDIAPYVDKWRKELEIKLRARALKEIIDTANSVNGAKNCYEANKFLVTGGWLTGEEKREAAKRGRPRKEEIKDKAVREFIEGGEQIDRDLARLSQHLDRKTN